MTDATTPKQSRTAARRLRLPSSEPLLAYIWHCYKNGEKPQEARARILAIEAEAREQVFRDNGLIADPFREARPAVASEGLRDDPERCQCGHLNATCTLP